VTPQKGDPVAPPPGPEQYELRYDSADAVKGWRDLCSQAKSNTERAWLALRNQPTPNPPTARQHPLKGDLATVKHKGVIRSLWQYEVTSGGRIWYVVDEDRKIVWLTKVSVGHPRQTDK
jgi:hypothetical protein